MMSRYSVFCQVAHKIILFFLICILIAACQDESLTESYIEDVDGMATLALNIPTSGPDASEEEKIENVRVMAFASRTAGSTGDKAQLQHNGIVKNGAQILLPVGKSDFYISANMEYEKLGLANVVNPEELKGEWLTFEQITQPKYPMLGVYKNINIKNGEAKDDNGNKIDVGKNLKRIASKLTLNLKYIEKSGQLALTVDSVKVFNRPAKVSLLPTVYNKDKKYVSENIDMKNVEISEVKGDTTVYKQITFFLSEYLLSRETINSSTYVSMYTHIDEKTTQEYKVYIGDWFGTMNYSEFPKESPDKVGVNGLNVTRGRNYILNARLNGSGVDNSSTVKVEDWIPITISGDILHPVLNISDTELLINPLNAEGTRLVYSTNDTTNLKVVISDNPNNRFLFEFERAKGEIRFKHKIDGINTLEKSDGKPIVGEAKIILGDTLTGPATVKKVKLIVFNPISRYYLRGKGGDYSNSSSVEKTQLLQTDWRIAKGYRSSYSGFGDMSKKGFDSYTQIMGSAASDTISGCSEYWEKSPTDIDLGKGKWRLPKATSLSGDDATEIQRMYSLLSQLTSSQNFEKPALINGGNIWGNEDVSEQSDMAYFVSTAGIDRVMKSSQSYVRCIRDISSKKVADASYLNVSHSYYELPLYAYRQEINPITFQSDADVDIQIYDESGVNISNIQSLFVPFSGYIEIDATKADYRLVFPNWYTNGKMDGIESVVFYPFEEYFSQYAWKRFSDQTHGDLYLELNMYKKFPDALYVYIGEVYGASPISVMNKEYQLVFTAGSISRTVRVKVVNNLAKTDLLQPIDYFEAHGVRRKYVGYDLKKNEIINIEKDYTVNEAIFESLVPDTLTGCAAYYEGSPSDPETGIGNWRLTSLYPRGIYNYMQGMANRYKEGAADWYNNPYNWSQHLGVEPNVDALYWSNEPYAVKTYENGPFDNRITQKISIYKPYDFNARNRSAYKTEKHYARCVRDVHKYKLQLSSQVVKFELGKKEQTEILFYTDANEVKFTKLYFNVSKDSDPFKVTQEGGASGKIRIECNSTKKVGDKMNLLLETVGDNPKMKMYKIISVQIIN